MLNNIPGNFGKSFETLISALNDNKFHQFIDVDMNISDSDPIVNIELQANKIFQGEAFRQLFKNLIPIDFPDVVPALLLISVSKKGMALLMGFGTSDTPNISLYTEVGTHNTKLNSTQDAYYFFYGKEKLSKLKNWLPAGITVPSFFNSLDLTYFKKPAQQPQFVLDHLGFDQSLNSRVKEIGAVNSLTAQSTVSNIVPSFITEVIPKEVSHSTVEIDVLSSSFSLSVIDEKLISNVSRTQLIDINSLSIRNQIAPGQQSLEIELAVDLALPIPRPDTYLRLFGNAKMSQGDVVFGLQLSGQLSEDKDQVNAWYPFGTPTIGVKNLALVMGSSQCQYRAGNDSNNFQTKAP